MKIDNHNKGGTVIDTKQTIMMIEKTIIDAKQTTMNPEETFCV